MIFRPETSCWISVGEEKAVALLDAPVEAFKAALYMENVEKEHYIPETSRKNEGFLTSGQVNYVCRAGNFRKSGLQYTGALRVLKVMMGYEYLWVNVRVKGGAYGCMGAASADPVTATLSPTEIRIWARPLKLTRKLQMPLQSSQQMNVP